MRSLLKLGVCCCLAAIVASITLQEFDQTITNQCLSRINSNIRRENRYQPLANSLEAFVGFVEKIEKLNPSWSIYDVTKVIIKRFAFDGITMDKDGTATQESHYAHRAQIIDLLIPTLENPNYIFDENNLLDEEKCSMFFMLGHLVNTTYRDGLDEEVYVKSHAHQQNAPADTNLDQQKVRSAKYPREQGVVSLFGDEHHAIALGKVLIGIAAAEQPQIKKVGELFDWSKKGFPFLSKQMESVIAVTLGDVLAHSIIANSDGHNSFGSGGTWNTSYCTVEYKLHTDTAGATLAAVRGAIDGFLIATTLRKSQNIRDLSLSRVLRMYYDPRGLPSDNGQYVSYCKRQDFSTAVGATEQTETIDAFYNTYYALHHYTTKFDKDGDGKAATALSNLQSIGGLFSINDGRCATSQQENKCETSSNVFVILDDNDRGTNGFESQQRIIGRLASNLDIGVGAGSMSIFYNSRYGGANLHPVVLNATNQAVATCAISRRELNNIPESVDEDSLMRGLNSTLTDFELKTSEQSYSASKAVVIFKYGDFKINDQNKAEQASNIVRMGHRDTRVFGVGDNQRVLQVLTTSAQDIFVGMETSYQTLGDKLYEKICEVPSIFQVHNCWNRKNRNMEDNKHVGYVTPSSIQYWAMYPEYFHKSSVIEFKFVADGLNGEINVCFSRNNPNPREGTNEKSLDCQTSKAEDRELIFYMKDPCHTYGTHNCPPAYFSISGKKVGNVNRGAKCQSENCRRTDQIQFTFSHTGVYCSGSLMLQASPLALLVVMATLFFKK